MSGEAVYRLASTRYSRWIKVECVQMCGWQPPKSATTEAVKHTKTTGHETAVSYIHYHQRQEDVPGAAAPAEAREEGPES
jgi:hypothetical protein